MKSFINNFCLLGTVIVLTASTAKSEIRTLQTKNTSGRTGALLIPSGSPSASSSYQKCLPLMVAFHGQGGDGKQIIGQFQDLANSKGFLILAPDSRMSPSGQYEWQVGVEPNQITPDLTHSLACLKEIQAMSDVYICPKVTIAVGYSSGGSQAPYFATHSSLMSAFGVLHGGIFAGGLGSGRPRGWFSTGSSDSDRPVDGVQSDIDSVKGLLSVVFKVYPGGHDLSAEERADVVSWWLIGGSDSANPAATATPTTTLAPDVLIAPATATISFPNKFVPTRP